MTYTYQLLDIPAGELREEVDYRYGNRYFIYKQFRFHSDELPVVLCNESEFNLLKRYVEYVAENSESFITLEFASDLYDGTGEGFIDVKAEDVREAVGNSDYGIDDLMVIFHSDRDGGKGIQTLKNNEAL